MITTKDKKRSNAMTIGENIKRIRAEKRITQKQLADALGVSQAMVAQYESDKRNPKMETIKKIADALEVSIDELCDSKATMINVFRGNCLPQISHDVIPDSSSDFLRMMCDEIIKDSTDEEIREYFSYCSTTYKPKEIFLLLNQLNEMGQDKALEQIELLSKIPEYRKE